MLDKGPSKRLGSWPTKKELERKMKKLEKLRGRIDRIDSRISLLLVRRFGIAKEIGNVKKKACIKIENKNREKKVVEKVVKKGKGTVQKKAIYSIYKEIIKQTKNLER